MSSLNCVKFNLSHKDYLFVNSYDAELFSKTKLYDSLNANSVIDLTSYKVTNFFLILDYLETGNYPTLTKEMDIVDLHNLANYLGVDKDFIQYVNFNSEDRFKKSLNKLDTKLVEDEVKLRETLFDTELKYSGTTDNSFEMQKVIRSIIYSEEFLSLYGEELKSDLKQKNDLFDEGNHKFIDSKFVKVNNYIALKKLSRFYHYCKTFDNIFHLIHNNIISQLKTFFFDDRNGNNFVYIDSKILNSDNLKDDKLQILYIRLLKELDYVNYVVAGGFIYFTKNYSDLNNFDIDIFLTTQNYIEAMIAIRSIYKTFSSIFLDNVIISLNQNVINFTSKFSMNNPNGYNTSKIEIIFTVQIILRLYNSISQVISGFDIDSCCIAYNGKDFYAMPRFVRSLICGYNLVDPERQSKNYTERLVKYACRGFAIALPGFINKNITCNFLKNYNEYTGISKIIAYFIKTYSGKNSKCIKTKNISDYEYSAYSTDEYGIYKSIRNAAISFYKKNQYTNKDEFQKFLDNIDFLDNSSCNEKRDLFGNYHGAINYNLFKYLRDNNVKIPLKVDYNLDYILNSATSKRSKLMYDCFESSLPDKITFNVKNPGTQKTGSFNPTTEDWYNNLYLN